MINYLIITIHTITPVGKQYKDSGLEGTYVNSNFINTERTKVYLFDDHRN